MVGTIASIGVLLVLILCIVRVLKLEKQVVNSMYEEGQRLSAEKVLLHTLSGESIEHVEEAKERYSELIWERAKEHTITRQKEQGLPDNPIKTELEDVERAVAELSSFSTKVENKAVSELLCDESRRYRKDNIILLELTEEELETLRECAFNVSNV